jgi:hypothetical protein
LHGEGIKTSDDAETVHEVIKHGANAHGLVGRDEGVEIACGRPCDRHHDGGCIEFHRAGTERNHSFIESQITGFELVDVAHHFGF